VNIQYRQERDPLTSNTKLQIRMIVLPLALLDQVRVSPLDQMPVFSKHFVTGSAALVLDCTVALMSP
jgi:hypothetical protein